MQEPIVFVEFPNNKWGEGVAVNEYNGNYSVVAAQRSKTNGKIYMRFAYPQNKDKQPLDTAVPMGPKIGDRKQSIAFFKQALAALSDRSGDVPHNDPVPRGEDLDLPF